MSLKKTIKFSKNWNNKLNNNIFTTIRGANFWVNDGDYCVIVLENKLLGYAKCIDKYQIKAVNVSPTILLTDVGLPLDHCKQIFKNFGIDLMDKELFVDVLTLKRMPNPDTFSKEITQAIQNKLF